MRFIPRSAAMRALFTAGLLSASLHAAAQSPPPY